MIVSRDDFLLLAQKWHKSSTPLRLTFIFGGKTSVSPASSGLIVKLSVLISRLDSDASMLVCSPESDQTGVISIGFEGAVFDFGTSVESHIAALDMEGEEEIDEALTVWMACGLVLVFVSFKGLLESGI